MPECKLVGCTAGTGDEQAVHAAARLATLCELVPCPTHFGARCSSLHSWLRGSLRSHSACSRRHTWDGTTQQVALQIQPCQVGQGGLVTPSSRQKSGQLVEAVSVAR